MEKTLASLDPHARQLAVDALLWMDQFWDEAAGLPFQAGDLYQPGAGLPLKTHTLRNAVVYALGLLLRNAAGDTPRAVRTLETVLQYQFDEPDQPYHGTFYRYPEEAHPPAEPRPWRDYDPNWREFICTNLAVILEEYAQRLPTSLIQKIDAAFEKAVVGAIARQLPPGYTNIALMNAFLLHYAGVRQRRSDWVALGEQMAQDVYTLFKAHDTFDEYNSPTYYGVDLFALVFWRKYATSPRLRQLGAEMEARLWRDISRYYHAGLRNQCGPFDRSYGMDMCHYMSLLGEWIYLLTGEKLAPLPTPRQDFRHASDYDYALYIAFLGAQVPADILPHFLAFQGERQIEQVITSAPRRVATAWLSPALMIGAEHTAGSRMGGPQFHPATVHWQLPAAHGGQSGWLRLRHTQPVDATAAPHRLTIEGQGELAFECFAPGALFEGIQPARWQLPGLTVQLSGAPAAIHFTQDNAHGTFMIHYAQAEDETAVITLEFTVE